MSKKDQILDLLQPDIESIGFEVVDLVYIPNSKTLRVFIDHLAHSEDRAISLEDCVTVDRAITPVIEASELLPDELTLEVSSPGVERPLRKNEDYERFAGKLVKIKTFRALTEEELNLSEAGKATKEKVFEGTLKGLDENKKSIVVERGQDLLKIPLDLVSQAKLQFKL